MHMHDKVKKKRNTFTTNQNFGAADTVERGHRHLNPEASRLS